jgi:hypothetical protein
MNKSQSQTFPLVILESPFAGQIERNTAYARVALRNSLHRGEAPFASHLLYTQPGVLRDSDYTERRRGIACGYAWMEKAEYVVFYVDYGMSPSMKYVREKAQSLGLPITYHKLDGSEVSVKDLI